jgi:hypothetical protein
MYVITITSSLPLLYSCQQTSQKQTDIAVKIATNTAGVVDDLDKADQRNVSDAFKSYWYKGQAEITSYRLKQARYGEMRDGTAVLIYVTEDFLPKEQVKADNPTPSNIPVLKLNATKNFNTGIYPYSIMTSTFYPVYQNEHAVKISQSMQEWCGHVYAQLNNRKSFDIDAHSYFEGEADQNFSIQKDILENELWTQLRLDPSQLPTGSFEAIPDLSYIRLKHVKLKAYEATGTLTKDSYTITYPSLKRTLQIQFESDFPYTITAWKETFVSGFGTNAKTMTTEATAIKTIQSAYWGKNSNTDAPLRQELGLD